MPTPLVLKGSEFEDCLRNVHLNAEVVTNVEADFRNDYSHDGDTRPLSVECFLLNSSTKYVRRRDSLGVTSADMTSFRSSDPTNTAASFNRSPRTFSWISRLVDMFTYADDTPRSRRALHSRRR